ncbi:hypothetical protein [Goodfellowiella coeruleoviolacea]|uniref:Uncharacterized protein n=1 Tax=Goodfellowiella coeruleoviolacea TaxID=334858 RepID=A0AAE3KJK7_9PSEU|nr:hypothetical protein [Goodfellowiella coeruleoviolacea]MCP2169192.1 hypothetical protein [Goodfellowiella coeruleoviolacea]
MPLPVGRVSASDAVTALKQSGHAVTPAALRLWRFRGHLSPGPGYDLVEIARYLAKRRTT